MMEATYFMDGACPSMDKLAVGTLESFRATTSLGNWLRPETGPAVSGWNWNASSKLLGAPAAPGEVEGHGDNRGIGLM